MCIYDVAYISEVAISIKRRVLFVCSGNASRSQMAEALLRHHASDYFEVASAGTHPSAVDEKTLEALQRQGISTRGLYSKSLESVLQGPPFDFVITLCDKARQECAMVAGFEETLHWDVMAPKQRTESDPYHKTLLELSERIKMFVLIKTKKG